jgi:RNA-directed DNA polymerase
MSRMPLSRSRSIRSQQKTSTSHKITVSKQLSLFEGEASLAEDRVKPEVKPGELMDCPAQAKEYSRDQSPSGLLEEVLSSANMRAALRRVKQNGGAPGIDGMSVSDLAPYLKENWPSLKHDLLLGIYAPCPVKRVDIPKPRGGTRSLGIPTVVDRLIQQALLQVLTPLFDPYFSPQSFGFRPGKRGHDAVRLAREYVRDGYTWVVDLDLEKFFDRVNHDMLMARVARRVTDKRILHLIRQFLESGVLLDGSVANTEEGTPQGGPLSPLLSNILLDDLDKELTRRGHKFVRYADDCNIYVRSKRAGLRVMASLMDYLQTRLKLKVNVSKSAVDRPWQRKFLGFSILTQQRRIRMAPQSLERVKAKIRELTRRTRSCSLEDRLERLNRYLQGWIGYFALAETPSVFDRLDQWIRRRLRMCLWKQWKTLKNRAHNLRILGASPLDIREAIGTGSRRYWRVAHCPTLQKTLTNQYWKAQGLVSLKQRWEEVRQAW